MSRVNSSAIRHSRALPSARALTLGLAVTLFVLFCVLPVVYMFIVSLTDAAGSFTLDNYRQLLTEPRQRGLMLTSIVLGGGAAIFATVLGAPLGLLFARARLPAKRFLRLALIVPLVVPPYIMALAWVLLTGPVGLFARAAGHDFLSDWTYSLTGAIVVLGLTFYPLSMLATEAAARRVDARLEESALLAASPRRVLWRITLPLIGPTVAAAGLIVFVLALSEFGVPALLRVRVFTTEAFTAFAAFYDFGAGVALCAPLLVVALIVSVVIKFIIGERLLVTTRSLQLGLPLTFSRPFRTAILIGIAVVISCINSFTACGTAVRDNRNQSDRVSGFNIRTCNREQLMAGVCGGDINSCIGCGARLWTCASAQPCSNVFRSRIHSSFCSAEYSGWDRNNWTLES